MNPKDRTDFRERVRRETLRGKLAVFHENIETYLIRQARAFTTTRVFLHWYLGYLITKRCVTIFMHTFPDKHHYGKFRNHPNYIKLGAFWSWTYYLRCWASILFGLFSVLGNVQANLLVVPSAEETLGRKGRKDFIIVERLAI
jgi:hypothetical protein